MAWRAGGGARRAASCASSSREKTTTEAAPKTAMASRPAARATALFTPDAAPAWRSSSIDVITVVVSGATVVAMPRPRTSRPGKYADQYVPPLWRSASSAKPPPAMIGPTISSGREPMRSASAPVNRDSSDIVATIGSSAAPASAGV